MLFCGHFLVLVSKLIYSFWRLFNGFWKYLKKFSRTSHCQELSSIWWFRKTKNKLTTLVLHTPSIHHRNKRQQQYSNNATHSTLRSHDKQTHMSKEMFCHSLRYCLSRQCVSTCIRRRLPPYDRTVCVSCVYELALEFEWFSRHPAPLCILLHINVSYFEHNQLSNRKDCDCVLLDTVNLVASTHYPNGINIRFWCKNHSQIGRILKKFTYREFELIENRKMCVYLTVITIQGNK